MKNNYLDKKNDFNKLKKEIREIEITALRTSGNSYTSISLSYYENKDWLSAFDFNLSALISRKRMYAILSKTPPIDENSNEYYSVFSSRTNGNF